MAESNEPIIITVCPDGPLLVRGDIAIAPAPGMEPIRPDRRVVALCRCGASGIKPLCDGTHKLTKFRSRGDNEPHH